MDPTSLEVEDLRQGDICMIDVFPLWNDAEASRIITGTKISGLQLSVWENISIAAKDATKVLVAVCSYDCDLENPRSRWGVALAPLVPLASRHRDYADLLASGAPIDDDDAIAFKFLNSYPYAENPLFVNSKGESTAGMVDFSAILHMGKAKEAIDSLRSRVVFRLDDEQRTNFQMKLAMFMARF